MEPESLLVNYIGYSRETKLLTYTSWRVHFLSNSMYFWLTQPCTSKFCAHDPKWHHDKLSIIVRWRIQHYKLGNQDILVVRNNIIGNFLPSLLLNKAFCLFAKPFVSATSFFVLDCLSSDRRHSILLLWTACQMFLRNLVLFLATLWQLPRYTVQALICLSVAVLASLFII